MIEGTLPYGLKPGDLEKKSERKEIRIGIRGSIKRKIVWKEMDDSAVPKRHNKLNEWQKQCYRQEWLCYTIVNYIEREQLSGVGMGEETAKENRQVDRPTPFV